jgi:hypothetical protein
MPWATTGLGRGAEKSSATDPTSASPDAAFCRGQSHFDLVGLQPLR